jgi:V/A-type H+-transporting ATPase subunit A
MMKVIGEEGTSMDDFTVYLKAEFLDSVYLQQNGFDKVDAATSLARQEYVFGKIYSVLEKKLNFDTKDNARKVFHALRQLFVDWNYKEWQSQEFKEQEKKIEEFLDTQMSTEGEEH